MSHSVNTALLKLALEGIGGRNDAEAFRRLERAC